jgi:hypothetical protein
MAHLSYDQSASVRCKTHGRRASAIFVRPESNEQFPAFYTCLHCVKDAGIGDEKTVSKDRALALPRLK